ncbi:peptidoglycan DD-metalloendopeptidase family protein [Spongiimicrobium salis]|uniref:peptidoglycan DD-metalloendopeptidase family protein n=1 Tax=Spongiimicrobium salis TaxID=1667022 RepID=UPI00374D6CDF
MTDLLTYFFHSSMVFSILYLFFRLFLQQLTFHHTNRWVLLAIIPLALGLPLIQAFFPLVTLSYPDPEIPIFTEQFFSGTSTLKAVPLSEDAVFKHNYPLYIFGIYVLGVLWHSIRFIQSLLHVRSLRQNSEMVSTDGVHFLLADVPTIFSCFHWIFIPKKNQGVYNSNIIEHEKVHVRLKHSRDLILSELYAIVFWYNPLVYLFKKSLKAIHEFQADHAVVQQTQDKIAYLTLLKTHISNIHTSTLYSNFHQPIIKKRIDMITKKNSPSTNVLRYSILLPLIIFFVMAFRTAEPEKIVLPAAIENSSFDTVPHEVASLDALPNFIFPIENSTPENITSPFGQRKKDPIRKKPIFHRGIDVRAKSGTPIIAVADGVVTYAALKGDWGNLIHIRHSDGYETAYAHLKGFAVKANEKVKKGAIIGYVGNTGASLGPHLHFEIKKDQKPVDPMSFFDQ